MRTADQVMEMTDLMSNDQIQYAVISMIDRLVERVSEDTPSMRVITDAKLTATTSTVQIIELHARRRASELVKQREARRIQPISE